MKEDYSDRGNNCINCDVASCNYNNEKGKCTLSNIKIGSSVNHNYCMDKDNIVCYSFKPGIRMDYEYAKEILDELNH